jgi:hypothetical protein
MARGDNKLERVGVANFARVECRCHQKINRQEKYPEVKEPAKGFRLGTWHHYHLCEIFGSKGDPPVTPTSFFVPFAFFAVNSFLLENLL